MSTEIQNISIDLGYGDTKVFYENKYFKFPSAISQIGTSQIKNEVVISDTYVYNGKTYRVGEKSINKAIATRGFNFLANYAPLLIFHALKLANLDLNKPIAIATGLSLVNHNEFEEFSNILKSFIVNDMKIQAKIYLFAQGQGIFCDFDRNDKETISIIDIGYNTLDFLVFEDTSPRFDLCFANKSGANSMITNLANILSQRYNIDINEQLAKKVFLEKSFKIAGSNEDFTDCVNNLIDDYSQSVFDEIINKSGGDILTLSDKVIIGGGGAYFLNKDIISKTHKANYIFAENPYEFSNVRGYYKKAFLGN